MRLNPEEAFVPRATCWSCLRPPNICVCQLLSTVNNQTQITILQHAREQFHPLNTTRIAEGSLERVRVVRGGPKAISKELKARPFGPGAALLYPSPEAIDLSEIAPDQRPTEVVVVDGTWHHAHTLVRDVEALRHLPHVRFTPDAPSEYRIRQEPRVDYHSTIESIAHVLERLEPELTSVEGLRGAFRAMIDRNIHARRAPGVESGGRMRIRGKHLPHRFDPRLATPKEDTLLVYAEGSRTQRGPAEPLIILVAPAAPSGRGKPPFTDGPLRLVIKTKAPPRPSLLNHLGIDEDELAGALSFDEATQALTPLMSQYPLVVAFSASTFDLLQAVGLALESSLCLKNSFCNLRRYQGEKRTTWGTMGDILERDQIPWAPLPGPGRPAKRLGQTYAFLEYLAEAHRAAALLQSENS